jgi:hypothetical protein
VPSLVIDPSGIELGPDLPMPVFTSLERWHHERIGALALYCSDGRWGEAFDEFCHKHLQIPRYDRWAVPGGPGFLVRAEGDTDHNPAARAQIDFLVENHKLEQVVLITHYACAYYTHGSERTARECLPDQSTDVRTAANLLRRWHPNLRVQAFLAMRRESNLSFHGLET